MNGGGARPKHFNHHDGGGESERVADGDVEHEFVADPRQAHAIEGPALAFGEIWLAQGDGEIEPDDDELRVDAQAHAAGHGHFADEILPTKYAPGSVLGGVLQPDVSGIDENRSEERRVGKE